LGVDVYEKWFDVEELDVRCSEPLLNGGLRGGLNIGSVDEGFGVRRCLTITVPMAGLSSGVLGVPGQLLASSRPPVLPLDGLDCCGAINGGGRCGERKLGEKPGVEKSLEIDELKLDVDSLHRSMSIASSTTDVGD
jgi:hypothetical protein